MADRSVKVTLRAEVNDFVRQMGTASKSLDDLAKKAGQSEGASTTHLGRLAQSAQLQRESWDAAGGALLAYGSAVTGLGLAAVATGIQYNQLQQTTRAALTTILGSAEAAANQMDRLDEFARQSPFSKQTFITAQQQMLAFGIEADKVVTYLGAIEDAVAAAGGNNQQISELSFIMAQISAAGKITAQDLMQFGQRGVDAASLIGSQMDLTGAEIREKITAGTLDAGQALDALAAGMEERYGGAAASVKDTLSGAFDRVQAAWRDLSAQLAAPLVNPNGGGFLVDTLNGVADLMRAFENLPGPVKAATTAFVGASGSIAILGGGLLLLAPRWQEFTTKIKDLSGILHGFSGGLAGVARNIGLLSAGVGLAVGVWQFFAQKQREAEQRVQELVATLDESTGALTENTRAAVVARLESEGVLETYQSLGGNLSDLTDVILGNGDALSRVNGVIEDNKDSFWGYSAEANEVRRVLGNMTGELDRAQEAFGRQQNATGESSGALEVAASVAKNAAEAQGILGGEVEDTSGALDEYIDKIQEVIDLERERAGLVMSAMEAESRFQEAIDAASEALSTNGKNLDLTTEKGRENQAALLDVAESGWGVVESLQAQGAPAENVRAAMQRARDQFIATATSMGMSAQEAGWLADSLRLVSGDYLARVGVTGIGDAQNSINSFISRNTGRVITVAVNTTGTARNILGGPVWAQSIGGPAGIPSFAGGGTFQRRSGAIYGPGTTTSDSIPAMLSRDEHILTAAEVSRAGGHDAVYRMRSLLRAGLLRFADGGTPSRVYQPTQYMTQIATTTPVPSLDGTPITAVFPGLPAIQGVIRQEIGADHAATAAAGRGAR